MVMMRAVPPKEEAPSYTGRAKEMRAFRLGQLVAEIEAFAVTARDENERARLMDAVAMVRRAVGSV